MKDICMIFRTLKQSTSRNRHLEMLILPQPHHRSINKYVLRMHCVPSTVLSSVVIKKKIQIYIGKRRSEGKKKNNRITIQHGKCNYIGSTEDYKRHCFQLDKVQEIFPEGGASELVSSGESVLTRWRRGMCKCMEGENMMLAGKSK